MKNQYPFTTLAQMKKDPNLHHYKNDKKQNIFYNLDALNKTWFTPCIIDQIIKHIENQDRNSTIECHYYVLHTIDENNGKEFYIDIDMTRTNIYSEKTNKRLYTYKEVCSFRLKQYTRNIYGVVPNNAIPSVNISYGSLEGFHKSFNLSPFINQDVEI